MFSEEDCPCLTPEKIDDSSKYKFNSAMQIYMDDFFTLKFLLETRGNLKKGSPEEIKT
jgi:hypothetical protein